MIQQLPLPRLATSADFSAIIDLADQCVGQGLYTVERLAHMFSYENRYFLLQEDILGSLLGYCIGYILPACEASAIIKCTADQACSLFPHGNAPVAICQSIGVSPKARGLGIAYSLQSQSTDALIAQGATMLFGLCWRQNGHVAIATTLEQLGFSYLFDTKDVWSDAQGLICTTCNSINCSCAAAIYIKKGALYFV